MHSYIRHYIIAGLVLLLASCSGTLSEQMPESLSGKVLAEDGPHSISSVLLNLDGAPDAALLSVLEECGVASVGPLFNMDRGDASLKRQLGMDRWYEAVLAEGVSAEDAAARLGSLATVNFVQLNKLYSKASDCRVVPYPGCADAVATKADGVFNDPLLPEQWAYGNEGSTLIANDACAGADINVKDVWANLTTGDNSVIVAVVDEGVKYSHPDLEANMWSDPEGHHGYNFVDNSYDITWSSKYDTGHGTHCAGVIAAVNNNGTGVSGIAGGSGAGDGVRIMSCQVFSGKSGGTDAAVARAFEYAADNGASILSCSFGYDSGTFKSDDTFARTCPAEVAALRYFQATKNNPVVDGGIVIFASGNDGKPYCSYPGALSDIISVTAFAPDFLPTYYTNYGPGCNIAAPGGEYNHRSSREGYMIYSAILSTVPSEIGDNVTNETGPVDYAYMQGTSMACPHVSGIAALALSYALKLGKTFSADEFKSLLLTSAGDIDSRLVGLKSIYKSEFALEPYFRQMGTGAIDAWQLMMKIEGVPSSIVIPGAEQGIDLSPYFGTSSVNLTYLGVEVLGNGDESLGLARDPYVDGGRLYVHPTKVGSARVRISAVAGGSSLGSEDSMGGMEVSQVVSVVARNVLSSNGGWL